MRKLQCGAAPLARAHRRRVSEATEAGAKLHEWQFRSFPRSPTTAASEGKERQKEREGGALAREERGNPRPQCDDRGSERARERRESCAVSPLPPSPSRRGQTTAASKWRCTTIYYDAAAASTSNGETVGPIEGDLDPSFDRLDPRKGSPGSHNTANPLSPSPPSGDRECQQMPSFLPSRVAKVENCTSIAPTSLFLIGEGDGRRGEEEEAGQSQTIKGEREVATSVRPSVCLPRRPIRWQSRMGAPPPPPPSPPPPPWLRSSRLSSKGDDEDDDDDVEKREVFSQRFSERASDKGEDGPSEGRKRGKEGWLAGRTVRARDSAF